MSIGRTGFNIIAQTFIKTFSAERMSVTYTIAFAAAFVLQLGMLLTGTHPAWYLAPLGLILDTFVLGALFTVTSFVVESLWNMGRAVYASIKRTTTRVYETAFDFSDVVRFSVIK
jgi:Na+-translocating ferredoxin:NAD+ oxidoreductase RnfD subunit